MAVDTHALTPGEGYLDAAASRLLAFAAADIPDLSRHLVLVSSLPLAAELRSALARIACWPLLLPKFDTLRRWALAADLSEIEAPMPESERLVLLHSALAARGWFDERALWGIAAELAGLSDELSAAAVCLPGNECELVRQLERAYALRASEPLNFEARVVHEMWRALAATGRPDAPSVYRLRLAQLAQRADRPLFVLVDGPADERLTPAELQFIESYGESQPVYVCAAEPRATADTPIAAVLAAAWPEMVGEEQIPPLRTRAESLAALMPTSPLSGRLSLVSASGREAEAEAAAAQVFAWLGEGLRRIALIAEDRLTARRVRALLERSGVLAADETGWKLSTTRAAATLDAMLETVASNAYHLDLLDLFKSPHLFGDVPADSRAAAVQLLEQRIRRAGVKSGVPAFRRVLTEHPEHSLHADEAAQGTAGLMLDRLEVAQRILGGKPAPLAKWIDRLLRSLDALGAAEPLRADAAGSEILELLIQRQGELAESVSGFGFAAWRDWFNRELESGAFRDRGIASSIVMLPRHDVRLRGFEAAIVIGADAEQLAPAVGGTFFNQAVRRDLGLPTREDAERALRRDLELLLSTVPRVVVTWQREQDGEARLLAPEFDLLSTLHHLAWGDGLKRAPQRAMPEAVPAPEVLPVRPILAAPVAPLALVPARLSVSGLGSLVACPYQFFARHVLRLNELDEVAEEMEKSEYGQFVHRSLERFHTEHPVLAELDDARALAALTAIVEAVFAEAEADNWLALGWRLRWQARLPAYLAWQREREASGWLWLAAEMKVARSLPLPEGAAVELYGRIDRLDAGPEGSGLLDYKAKKLGDLKKLVADDIQLPAYALLHGGAAEAAYVALDDEKIGTVACAGNLGEAAIAQGERLTAIFSAIRAGASLPAHGIPSICRWCEASGLCRREHVQSR